jgi:hypothetical protein
MHLVLLLILNPIAYIFILHTEINIRYLKIKLPIRVKYELQNEGMILGRKCISLLILIALIGMATADSEEEEQ